MFELLQTPSLHENMVKIGAFVLSEFGHLIAKDSEAKSLEKQF
jgi:AP-2 complex subunit alpha